MCVEGRGGLPCEATLNLTLIQTTNAISPSSSFSRGNIFQTRNRTVRRARVWWLPCWSSGAALHPASCSSTYRYSAASRTYSDHRHLKPKTDWGIKETSTTSTLWSFTFFYGQIISCHVQLMLTITIGQPLIYKGARRAREFSRMHYAKANSHWPKSNVKATSVTILIFSWYENQF